jgi:hypothetical protein
MAHYAALIQHRPVRDRVGLDLPPWKMPRTETALGRARCVRYRAGAGAVVDGAGSGEVVDDRRPRR